MSSVGTSSQGTKSRRRHPVSSIERQAIRRQNRQNPAWTQETLARWASAEFGRPIRQCVISECLRAKQGFLCVEDVVNHWSNHHVPRPEEQSALQTEPYGHTILGSVVEARESVARETPNNPDVLVSSRLATAPSIEHLRFSSSPRVYPLLADPDSVGKGHAASDEIVEERDDQEHPRLAAVKKEPDVDTIEPANSPSRPDVQESWQLSRLDEKSVTLHSPKSFNLYLGQLFTGLVHKASRDDPMVSDLTTRWLMSLVDRLPNSVPLYEATRCLLVQHAGVATGDARLTAAGLPLYSRALRGVAAAVKTGKGVNPDLVSAVMLLSYYELFRFPNEEEASLKHTQGASRLLAMLGPKSFDDHYGHLVLLAFATHIMFYLPEDEDNENSFLRSKEWADAILRARKKETSSGMEGIVQELYAHTFLAIKLRREVKVLLGSSTNTAKRVAFLERLFQLRRELCVWDTHFRMLFPFDDPNHSPGKGATGAGTIRSAGSRAASVWCAYVAVHCTVNRMIMRLSPGLDYTEEEKSMTSQVDEAVEMIPMNTLLAKRAIWVSDRCG